MKTLMLAILVVLTCNLSVFGQKTPPTSLICMVYDGEQSCQTQYGNLNSRTGCLGNGCSLVNGSRICDEWNFDYVKTPVDQIDWDWDWPKARDAMAPEKGHYSSAVHEVTCFVIAVCEETCLEDPDTHLFSCAIDPATEIVFPFAIPVLLGEECDGI